MVLTSQLVPLTPQRVRPGDRHSYWTAGWSLDTDRLGISAWDFAAAVAAEGVPLGGPYIGSSKEGPLYRNPFLAEPALYGESWFPFDYKRDERVDYETAFCPNGEALMQRTICMGMLPSYTDEDIRDIVGAMRKVLITYRDRAGQRIEAGVR